MIIALITNAALLMVFSLIYGVIYLLPAKYRHIQPAYSGFLISLICIAIMSIPFELRPGIMFDTRSILISVTALIFGLIPTLITAAVASITRLIIGGAGTLPGLAVILTSAVIGLAWRRLVYPKSKKMRWVNIFAMGVIVHVVMLACMLLLPYPDSLDVIRAVAVPVMVIYPIVSVILSLFLVRQQALGRAQDQLRQSEERFKLLFEQAPLGYLALDAKGCFVEVNQKWLDTFGYNKEEVIGKWLGDFLCPEYVDAFRQRFELFKTQGFIKSEVEIFSKEGKRLLIAFEGKIAYDSNGEFKQTHGIMQDITLQRETEKSLKESEERYRQLSEQSRTFTWEVDEQGLYTFVDHVSLSVLGYGPDELILKKHFYDIWTDEDRRNLKQAAFDVFEQKGLFNGMENRALTKSGDVVVLSTTGFPVLGDDGSLLGYRGSDTDITYRKRAEQALIHSHDLMRYIIEHNRSAVAVHDRDLKYLYVSQSYLDEYEVKDKDIIGKHHYEVFPDLPQKWRDVHQRALLGEVVSEEKDAYPGEGGSLKWTRWECRPWYEYDGSIGGIIVYTEVITDHIRLLDDLKDKEQNLRLAQEIAHVGSFRYEPAYNKLALSAESFNICGINKKDFSGETDEIIELIHPDDRDHALEITREAMTNMKVMRSELRIIRPDGEERIVDFRVQKALSENDNYVSITGTIQDITERKNVEENLIYLNNHDFLTGLFNRRYFEDEIKRLDVKENLPLSIIMADTDGLKFINDSFGHDMGDELLIKSAEAIKQACRAKDLIVRYGGDEFIIVLPNTNSEDTLKIANSIKEKASKVKVANIELSISYGYDIKQSANESIMEILANAENHMYSQKLSERSSMRSKTTEIIMNALFEKSHRESQHSMRVSNLCESISVKMKLDKQEINKIRIAGLVHDIGKIGIDEKILNKNGKLDNNERVEIEKHAEAGWRILNSSNEFAELAQCVLHHHERWDGRGYPRKLKGENIPIEARVIAVADSYDAMTSERSYKTAMSHEDAIREILKCSGTQFDPAIVDVFVN
jgi:diguanylate cyclase (GGDEF)-like protein/PAS domain S-box-containing protein/putative nucleotidyltransferase with HDIG domain